MQKIYRLHANGGTAKSVQQFIEPKRTGGIAIYGGNSSNAGRRIPDY